MNRRSVFIRLFCIGWLTQAGWGADGHFLVLQKAGSSLGFYDANGSLLGTVPVGLHPHEMSLSPDGRFLYTTDNGTMRIEQGGAGGNSISIIDLQARRKVGEVSLGRYHRPHGIDVDERTGRVYVSSENPDRLLVIDPVAQKVVRDYDTQGQTSHIVTLSRDGKKAYVSNSRSATVSAIDLESGSAKLIAAGQRPEGSVLSPDGSRLYVVNRDSNSISIIDTRTDEVSGTIATGGAPVRVGVTADGRTLVYALYGDEKVGFADIQTGRQTAEVALEGAPVSMAISPDGRFAYAAAQDIDTVYVISIADRKIVRSFKTVQGAGPDPVLWRP